MKSVIDDIIRVVEDSESGEDRFTRKDKWMAAAKSHPNFGKLDSIADWEVWAVGKDGSDLGMWNGASGHLKRITTGT